MSHRFVDIITAILSYNVYAHIVNKYILKRERVVSKMEKFEIANLLVILFLLLLTGVIMPPIEEYIFTYHFIADGMFSHILLSILSSILFGAAHTDAKSPKNIALAILIHTPFNLLSKYIGTVHGYPNSVLFHRMNNITLMLYGIIVSFYNYYHSK